MMMCVFEVESLISVKSVLPLCIIRSAHTNTYHAIAHAVTLTAVGQSKQWHLIFNSRRPMCVSLCICGSSTYFIRMMPSDSFGWSISNFTELVVNRNGTRVTDRLLTVEESTSVQLLRTWISPEHGLEGNNTAEQSLGTVTCFIAQ